MLDKELKETGAGQSASNCERASKKLRLAFGLTAEQMLRVQNEFENPEPVKANGCTGAAIPGRLEVRAFREAVLRGLVAPIEEAKRKQMY